MGQQPFVPGYIPSSSPPLEFNGKVRSTGTLHDKATLLLRVLPHTGQRPHSSAKLRALTGRLNKCPPEHAPCSPSVRPNGTCQGEQRAPLPVPFLPALSLCALICRGCRAASAPCCGSPGRPPGAGPGRAGPGAAAGGGAAPRPCPSPPGAASPRNQPVPLRRAAAAPIGSPRPGHLHTARPLVEPLPRLRFTCAAELAALGAPAAGCPPPARLGSHSPAPAPAPFPARRAGAAPPAAQG